MNIKKDIESVFLEISNPNLFSIEKRTFEALSKNLKAAENYLDEAESNFSNNTPTPFWDSIEKAYAELGKFHQNIYRIADLSIYYGERETQFRTKIRGSCHELEQLLKTNENWLQDYKYAIKDIEKYREKSKYSYPKFPVERGSIRKFHTKSNSISKRAYKIAKEALKHYEFAYIYEIRKNNKIEYSPNHPDDLNTLSRAINYTTPYLTEAIDWCERLLEERHSIIN